MCAHIHVSLDPATEDRPFTGLNLASCEAPLLYVPFTPFLLRKNKTLKFVLIWRRS